MDGDVTLKREWTNCMFNRLFFAIPVFLVVTAALSSAAPYPGFKELKEEQCTPLSSSLVQKLPGNWRKYQGFIKICPLAKDLERPAKVTLISIWCHEYLDSHQKTMWENFPLPLLVDDNFKEVGTVPEIFPMNSVTEPIIYYGRWKEGLPYEIRIDIYNPTVSGDYYYSPLKWDEKNRRYRMLDKEPKSGSRNKHRAE